ncbi:MAG TPA: slipin family protein [Phycisphaerales bacterium]|nr:slipin family protein [Phycisphaerales bacterium]
MKGSTNAFTTLILTTTTLALMGFFALGFPVLAIIVFVLGCFLSASPRQISEWERGVQLRFGRFKRVVGPGICWLIPGVDEISELVDMRVRSTSFSAEKTLTSDTVPVNVDAVLFWVVTDAKQAIVEVEDFRQTVSWAAQTTLRDVIGQTELVRMISDRESIDAELQKIIDAKTSDWGITVQSVEIRDMKIPGALEDAMSRKAQADREKEARIILAESERRVAEEMQKAAGIYHDDPIALKIRAMNMTYESIKERGALMVIPNDMVNSMNGSVVSMGTACFERNGASA